MTSKQKIQIKQISVESFVSNRQSFDEVLIRWLGQAGFEMFYKDRQLLIDPYLSDFLATKYAGKEFPHIRMMDPPIKAEQITGLDFILCSHAHSDHLDVASLNVILENNPDCRILAPAAERKLILGKGLKEDKIIFVTAENKINLADDISVEVLPSAHEELKVDEKGNHYYLGFILRVGDVTIYHSGDCVPYEGLTQKLQDKSIDVAILPVNGSDEYLASKGIAGNFTFKQAIELCENVNIPVLVCHHFGMFDFNTVSPEQLKKEFNENDSSVRPWALEYQYLYCLEHLSLGD